MPKVVIELASGGNPYKISFANIIIYPPSFSGNCKNVVLVAVLSFEIYKSEENSLITLIL